MFLSAAGSPNDTFDVGKDKLQIVTIGPEVERAVYDIGLPLLTPTLVRKKSLAEEIAALDVASLQRSLPLRPGSQVVRWSTSS